ncbi:MAG: flagellar hook-basal body complex protein FliE [Planctomycetaceae bacterium]
MTPIGGMSDSLATKAALRAVQPAATDAASGDSPFKDLLLSSLNETAELQNEAQRAAESWFAGDDITQVEVFTSMKKADIALKALLQIRNRALQAYNEIKDLRM